MIQYEVEKELFEAVMSITLTNSDIFNIQGENIIYKDTNIISLSDFFFKCTKWAFTLTPKYTLGSFYRSCSIYKQTTNTGFELLETFDNINQKQALFDACHRILELRKVNDTTKN